MAWLSLLSSLLHVLLLSLKSLFSLKVVEYLGLACEDFLFLLLFPDRAAPFWAEIARVIAEKSALLTWDAAVKPEFVVDHIILSNCP